MQLRDITSDDLVKTWQEVKRKKPLIFHVTNSVATQLQANICLAVGGSPIMSQYPEETNELLSLCQGFLVNLGTPTEAALKTTNLGMASRKNKACISLLDPVGYGASSFRIQYTHELLQKYAFSVLKGNSGEISLLAGKGGAIKGVDAVAAGNLHEGVLALARNYSCTVCATGEVDYISDGESVAAVYGGSPLLPFLSGSGCALGSIMLTCAAASNAILGSICGLIAMGIASERASKKSAGPGSFQIYLIDELYNLSPEDFTRTENRWSVEF